MASGISKTYEDLEDRVKDDPTSLIVPGGVKEPLGQAHREVKRGVQSASGYKQQKEMMESQMRMAEQAAARASIPKARSTKGIRKSLLSGRGRSSTKRLSRTPLGGGGSVT